MRLRDLVLGVGPDSERVGAWLDARPWACLALMALAALAVCTADGWWS